MINTLFYRLVSYIQK